LEIAADLAHVTRTKTEQKMNELYGKVIPIVCREVKWLPSLRLVVCKSVSAFSRASYVHEISVTTLGFYRKLREFPLAACLRIADSQLVHQLLRSFSSRDCVFAAVELGNDSLLWHNTFPAYAANDLYDAVTEAARRREYGTIGAFIDELKRGFNLGKQIIEDENLALASALDTSDMHRPCLQDYLMHLDAKQKPFNPTFASHCIVSLLVPRKLPSISRELLMQTQSYVPSENACCDRKLMLLFAHALAHGALELLNRWVRFQPSLGFVSAKLPLVSLQWLLAQPQLQGRLRQNFNCNHLYASESWECKAFRNAFEDQDYETVRTLLHHGLCAQPSDVGFSDVEENLNILLEFGECTEAHVLRALYSVRLDWAWQHWPSGGIELRKLLDVLVEGRRENCFPNLVAKGYALCVTEVVQCLQAVSDARQCQRWLQVLVDVGMSWAEFLKAAIAVKGTHVLLNRAFKIGCPIDTSACHHHGWFHNKYCETTPFPSRKSCPHHGLDCLERF
jgi:hypothetical protein